MCNFNEKTFSKNWISTAITQLKCQLMGVVSHNKGIQIYLEIQAQKFTGASHVI